MYKMREDGLIGQVWRDSPKSDRTPGKQGMRSLFGMNAKKPIQPD